MIEKRFCFLLTEHRLSHKRDTFFITLRANCDYYAANNVTRFSLLDTVLASYIADLQIHLKAVISTPTLSPYY